MYIKLPEKASCTGNGAKKTGKAKKPGFDCSNLLTDTILTKNFQKLIDNLATIDVNWHSQVTKAKYELY